MLLRLDGYDLVLPEDKVPAGAPMQIALAASMRIRSSRAWNSTRMRSRSSRRPSAAAGHRADIGAPAS